MTDFNAVIDAMQVEVALIDADGRILVVNRAWAESQRASNGAAVLGANFFEVGGATLKTEMEYEQKALDCLREVLSGSKQTFTLDCPSDGPKGRSWSQLNVTCDVSTGQRRAMLARRDVTERLTDMPLAQFGESHWKTLFVHAPVFIALLDRLGLVKFINQSDGWGRSQVMEKPVAGIFRPEHRAEIEGALKDVFEQRKTRDVIASIGQEPGPIKWYRVRIAPVLSAQEVREAITISLDITQEHQLEDQLRHSQKMEAVGRLAGGIAHDFNNLLTVVMGNAELLQAALPPGKPRDRVDQIYKTGKRAGELTQKLLAFSRRQILQPTLVRLGDVLKDSEILLKRLIGEDVELDLVMKKETRCVLTDVSQIEQALMNLVVNARDAMPNGGKLTIEAADIDLDEAYCLAHDGVTAGPHVMLAVTDSGVGMDAGTRSHLFEPFFTTKPKGKGTGLGLSMVHGVVKQLGGHIFVYSEPGHGASFKLYFPAVEGAPDSRQVTAMVPKLRGSEQVLLVEDDDGLRDLAAELLTSQGYKVHAAASPAHALQLIEREKLRPALLLTDVVMPGMSGRELADILLRSMPTMPVLYMSGYTENAIVKHGVLEVGMHFLPKPFSIDKLAAKVREVLDSKREPVVAAHSKNGAVKVGSRPFPLPVMNG